MFSSVLSLILAFLFVGSNVYLHVLNRNPCVKYMSLYISMHWYTFQYPEVLHVSTCGIFIYSTKFSNVRAIFKWKLFKTKFYGSHKFLEDRWRSTPLREKNLSKINQAFDSYNCGWSLSIGYSTLLPISLDVWNNCTFPQKCIKRQNS